MATTEQKDDETIKVIDWVTGSLGSYPLPELTIGSSVKFLKPADTDLDKVRVQQSDLLKPLLMDIAQFGLNYAYKKMLKPVDDHERDKFTSTKNPKKSSLLGLGWQACQLVTSYPKLVMMLRSWKHKLDWVDE